jgi:hypothetical protein
MIGTVRNVGYRFESQRDRRESRAESRGPDALHDAGPTSA